MHRNIHFARFYKGFSYFRRKYRKSGPRARFPTFSLKFMPRSKEIGQNTVDVLILTCFFCPRARKHSGQKGASVFCTTSMEKWWVFFCPRPLRPDRPTPILVQNLRKRQGNKGFALILCRNRPQPARRPAGRGPRKSGGVFLPHPWYFLTFLAPEKR